VKLEVLGAILTMIAPFIFHYLLQTELKIRNITLIMSGVILLGIIPVIDFGAIDKYLSLVPRTWLVRSTVIIAIVILGAWQFLYIRSKRGRDWMKTGIDALIFDMDGLMADTEKLYWAVLGEIAAGYGIRDIPETIKAEMMGRAPLESMTVFQEYFKLPVTAEKLLIQRDALMERKLQTGVEPMKGLFEIIAAFHGVFKLAIATSSSRRFLDIVVDKLGIRDKFMAFQTSDEITRGKPDPEIFVRTVAKLGVKPEECIILEDSVNGVLAGLHAGCYVIAVPSEYSKSQDFSSADFVAGDLIAAKEHILSILRVEKNFVN
jgi:HAD superfamily hydrolase (TIGR01509 family)